MAVRLFRSRPAAARALFVTGSVAGFCRDVDEYGVDLLRVPDRGPPWGTRFHARPGLV